MRLSDWSSDVCSSDLLLQIVAATDLARQKSAAERAIRDEANTKLTAGRQDRFFHEIGRASCRERVCQSVSISVVAVSLKKKSTTTARSCPHPITSSHDHRRRATT